MDVSNIANMATQLSNVRAQQTQETAVLKKAIDIQAEGALQLLASIDPSQGVAPIDGSNMGQTIDVRV